ncbi:uncharacterized protein L969DRAFT_47382 [Mixia osmundae IAM 14324]|uniref:Obg family GTPase CgtA n=1 Tax=Mixia osmundae (strain CBS 9802 / IAM 14324 / JCM 22182 / KY 12970) TaxID=764103 RepID=G7DVE1_MIXOS|nr:uncharacterized protein L969DRAFT_47382 [Mixia osmundae IAM 14324]KEI40329.1 hypothetical protein L969DRAFT_47382 [Mixia osmundae IAM 14324]GAA94551.1 hypothetical protein E5Q_01203 [Mixia osmundae IAM 14324]
MSLSTTCSACSSLRWLEHSITVAVALRSRSRSAFDRQRRPLSRRCFSKSAPSLTDISGSTAPTSTVWKAESWGSFSDHLPNISHMKQRNDKKRSKAPKRHFIDQLIVRLESGKGGDGSVAFQREKFKEQGPPAGGNGGQGGAVYIRAVAGLTSLGGVTKRVRAHNGGAGAGSWMHGRKGDDAVLTVPVGTIVRQIEELEPAGPSSSNPWTEQRPSTSLRPTRREKEALRDADDILDDRAQQLRFMRHAGISPDDASNMLEEAALKEQRERLFVHFPNFGESNESDENFLRIEQQLLKLERQEQADKEASPPVYHDLDMPTPEGEEILLLEGGQGGLGNPAFLSSTRRTPRYATRGRPGRILRIELELKSIADVGLVGFPNAGKSTFLRAVTNSKTEIASYAFTTLNPQIGTCLIYDDGTFGDGHSQPIEDTSDATRKHKLELAERQQLYDTRRVERFRMTLADCPGLLPDASLNVGLGHAFLRHIERSKVLAYVVDLSAATPWSDLFVLRDELEAYQPGLSNKARLIIANKADMLADPSMAGEAQARLAKLRHTATSLEVDDIQVVPVSAKLRLNIGRSVDYLRSMVEAGRARERERIEIAQSKIEDQ